MEVTAKLAATLGTAMPQGQVTLDTLMRAEEQGYGPRDMAAILPFMRKETP
jgi:3-hydroxyisobutyrate dehydrogenase